MAKIYASYGHWKFQPANIKKRAAAIAAVADDLLKDWEADAFAVRGSSGTFIAGPVQMLCDAKFVYVRKHGETSHGYPVEGPSDHEIRKVIVLDDFVDSGDTINKIRGALVFHDISVVAALMHCDVEVHDNPINALFEDTAVSERLDLPVFYFYDRNQ